MDEPWPTGRKHLGLMVLGLPQEQSACLQLSAGTCCPPGSLAVALLSGRAA